MMVLPTDLQTLVTDADRIVAGTVVAVEERQDEHGILCTYVTVQISQLLKGQLPTLFTFKQLGVQTRQRQGTLLRIPGMPDYHTGEEVVLFLHPTSAAGFTSPVGMQQGKFTVVRHGSKVQVRNSLGNINLAGAQPRGGTQHVPTAPNQSLPVDFDNFLSRVKALIHNP
jgi:hypothetical protein